jgi:hypothetical protein
METQPIYKPKSYHRGKIKAGVGDVPYFFLQKVDIYYQ